MALRSGGGTPAAAIRRSRRVRFVVTELIAQSIRRDEGVGPGIVELTVEVSERTVRVEAEGPGIPVRIANGNGAPSSRDRLPNPALLTLDELATSWGSGDGPTPRVWFEVDRARAVDAILAT